MRIAVFGAGGVGGYFGGRLAQSGAEVVFIARGEHLNALRRDGLRVDSIAGDFHLREVQASDAPGEIGAVDVVLLTVKSWQVSEAAQAMGPLLHDDTLVLPLLNGVEAAEELAALIGPQRVLGGLCRLVSFVAGPAHIRHTAVAPSLVFGERHGRATARVAALRTELAKAEGFEVHTPESIETAIWSKFLFIAPVSGVGAVTRVPVGELRTIPETRGMLEEAMAEVAALAAARGVTLPNDIVARTLDFLDAMPPDSTASMQRDILAGRPSELEQQSGAIVRLARPLGVPVPVNACLYRSLLPAERRARAQMSSDTS